MQSWPDEPSIPMLVRRLAKRWKPAVTVFATVFLLTAAVVLLLPNKYRTDLKILVKNERMDPLVGADKQTQGILYVNEISEARINTEIQLLTSADVLREVVSQCNLAALGGARNGSNELRSEIALRKLEKDLTVAPVRNSNVIQASYESKNPGQSAQVLKVLLEKYMSAHRTLHGAPGSYEFFHQRSAGYSAELADAEAELSRFGQAHQIVTLPEQKSLALANMAHLENRMEESAASAEKNLHTADHLKASIDEMPASIERQRRSMPNQVSTEQLTTVLNGLENKRAAASLRYQPEDRVIQELDMQIAQTRGALNSTTAASAIEVSMGADPAVDAARGEYLRVAADEAGDQAQTRELRRQLKEQQGRLMSLDAQSVTYRDLQRKVASLEELDESYRKRSEEARMAELLDQGSISNLAIVEQPFETRLPSSPKRSLLLALGLLWSLGLAVAVAVVLDLLHGRVRSPFELAEASGLPVLASLPAETTERHALEAFPALYLAMQRVPMAIERRSA